jgi:hypothetical protein
MPNSLARVRRRTARADFAWDRSDMISLFLSVGYPPVAAIMIVFCVACSLVSLAVMVPS